MGRRIVAVTLGLFSLWVSVFFGLWLLDALWQKRFADSGSEHGRHLLDVGIVIVHLVAGLLAGYLAAIVSSERPKRSVLWLAGSVFVLAALQTLGDWGHPFAFYWNVALSVLSAGGVLIGGWAGGRRAAPTRG